MRRILCGRCYRIICHYQRPPSPCRNIFIPRSSTLHWLLLTDIHSKLRTSLPSTIVLFYTPSSLMQFRHWYFQAWRAIAIQSRFTHSQSTGYTFRSPTVLTAFLSPVLSHSGPAYYDPRGTRQWNRTDILPIDFYHKLQDIVRALTQVSIQTPVV